MARVLFDLFGLFRLVWFVSWRKNSISTEDTPENGIDRLRVMSLSMQTLPSSKTRINYKNGNFCLLILSFRRVLIKYQKEELKK